MTELLTKAVAGACSASDESDQSSTLMLCCVREGQGGCLCSFLPPCHPSFSSLMLLGKN